VRITVASIMLDEPIEFIQRWADSSKDADYRILVDTGSSGEQVTYARHLGVDVYEIRVTPWRFDVARNAALALVPDCDTVVNLDVDEVLEPGWRDSLEAAGPAPRHSYHYQWSPDVSFLGDKIHSRYGWVWKHPCHETLYPADSHRSDRVQPTSLAITHLPDDTKSRESYLPLLALAVKESPDDDRMAHYYARELFFRGQWDLARREFMRHLSMPAARWPAERAQSYRYIAKMDDYPEKWLLKAAAEDPSRREVWVDLARWAAGQHFDELAAGYAERAMAITQRTGDYMSESDAWDDDALMAFRAPFWDHSGVEES